MAPLCRHIYSRGKISKQADPNKNIQIGHRLIILCLRSYLSDIRLWGWHHSFELLESDLTMSLQRSRYSDSTHCVKDTQPHIKSKRSEIVSALCFCVYWKPSRMLRSWDWKEIPRKETVRWRWRQGAQKYLPYGTTNCFTAWSFWKVLKSQETLIFVNCHMHIWAPWWNVFSEAFRGNLR